MDSGRMVERIWWNGANGDESAAPGEHQHMVTLNEYHGEYDVDWVLLVDGNGHEMARYNTRYLASIVWATKENPHDRP